MCDRAGLFSRQQNNEAKVSGSSNSSIAEHITRQSSAEDGGHVFLGTKFNSFGKCHLQVWSPNYYRNSYIHIELNKCICCRDEVSSELLTQSKVILVDHHIVDANINKENVLEIIDHRPIAEPLPPNCHSTIRDVGSCATLVADFILQTEADNEITDVLRLLHGPIVLDTVNFSVEADKTWPLDISVNSRIESLLGINEDNRNELFRQLVSARSAVDDLDSLQILSKDLKIISNPSKTVRVAIPGYPILVQVLPNTPTHNFKVFS